MKLTLAQRFAAKVVLPPSREPDGCWGWTGAVIRPNKKFPRRQLPYAMFRFNGRMRTAHRWSYEAFIGPIPEKLTIDHLCRNPSCTNPGHLEAVTLVENLRRGGGFGGVNARKTHCPQGHPYSPTNTYIEPWNSNGRRCVTCKKHRDKKQAPHRNRRRREQRRAKAAAEGRELATPGLRPHGTRGRYRQGCRCEPCRERSRAEGRARYPNNHGSLAMAVEKQCPCPTCRAVADRHARVIAKRTTQTEMAPKYHGTIYGYNYYGCRCDDCRRARTIDARERRAKKAVAVGTHGAGSVNMS